jgi:peptidoglycan hydrolase-like protein with peptidoglycan-binding domain
VDEQAAPEQIIELQNRLIELGWLAGEADGVYNEDTRAAVLAFQQKINGDALAELNEDGVADPLTMQWLFGENAPVYAPEPEA